MEGFHLFLFRDEFRDEHVEADEEEHGHVPVVVEVDGAGVDGFIADDAAVVQPLAQLFREPLPGEMGDLGVDAVPGNSEFLQEGLQAEADEGRCSPRRIGEYLRGFFVVLPACFRHVVVGQRDVRRQLERVEAVEIVADIGRMNFFLPVFSVLVDVVIGIRTADHAFMPNDVRHPHVFSGRLLVGFEYIDSVFPMRVSRGQKLHIVHSDFGQHRSRKVAGHVAACGTVQVARVQEVGFPIFGVWFHGGMRGACQRMVST